METESEQIRIHQLRKLITIFRPDCEIKVEMFGVILDYCAATKCGITDVLKMNHLVYTQLFCEEDESVKRNTCALIESLAPTTDQLVNLIKETKVKWPLVAEIASMLIEKINDESKGATQESKDMTMVSQAGETGGISSIDIAAIAHKVHVAIITVRIDEFNAMESQLGNCRPVVEGNNSYVYTTVSSVNGRSISVALTRCCKQGNIDAQAVANNVISDLDPSWLLLVGIAGGVPDTDFSLGDVIVTSVLHDFSFGASHESSNISYQAYGGPMHPDVNRFLQTKIVGEQGEHLKRLAGYMSEQIFLEHPPVFQDNLGKDDACYGDAGFKSKVLHSIDMRFPGGKRAGPQKIWSGPTVNGNRVVHDPNLLDTWKETARQVVNVETELAGVYMAAQNAGRQNYPLLSVRGLSDIIGLKRNHLWTDYACKTAAALAYAILRSELIDFSKNLPKKTE